MKKMLNLRNGKLPILIGLLLAGNAYAQTINYSAPSNIVNPQQNLSGVNQSTTISPIGSVNQGVPIIAPNGQLVVQQAPTSMPQDNTVNFSSNKNAEIIELMRADPDEIRKVLKEIEKRKRASKELTQAKAVQNSVDVNITPGSSVPVIRTFANRTSSLVVVDNSGKPWPIENFSLGSASDFVVKRLDKSAGDKGFMLDITPVENYVAGNLTLKLEGLNTPVVLEIISGQSEYDAPLLFKVKAAGPNSTITSVSLPEKEDPNLASVLQGVAPSGLTPLKVDSGLAQAWLSADGKNMYVRSKLRLMPFDHMTSSPDGTYAYKVKKLPALTYKYEDKFGQIIISGM